MNNNYPDKIVRYFISLLIMTLVYLFFIVLLVLLGKQANSPV